MKQLYAVDVQARERVDALEVLVRNLHIARGERLKDIEAELEAVKTSAFSRIADLEFAQNRIIDHVARLTEGGDYKVERHSWAPNDQWQGSIAYKGMHHSVVPRYDYSYAQGPMPEYVATPWGYMPA